MWVITKWSLCSGRLMYWSQIDAWTHDKSKAMRVSDQTGWDLNNGEAWLKVAEPVMESDEEEAVFE